MPEEKNFDVNEKNMIVHIGYIRRDISEIKLKLDKDYVTSQEFEPIKKIVYGVVSLILFSVIGALVALVII